MKTKLALVLAGLVSMSSITYCAENNTSDDSWTQKSKKFLSYWFNKEQVTQIEANHILSSCEACIDYSLEAAWSELCINIEKEMAHGFDEIPKEWTKFKKKISFELTHDDISSWLSDVLQIIGGANKDSLINTPFNLSNKNLYLLKKFIHAMAEKRLCFDKYTQKTSPSHIVPSQDLDYSNYIDQELIDTWKGFRDTVDENNSENHSWKELRNIINQNLMILPKLLLQVWVKLETFLSKMALEEPTFNTIMKH